MTPLPRVPSIRVLLALALIGTSLTIASGAFPAAAGTRTPKIKSAKMQDHDRDGRADAVLLAYTRRVKHPVDKDGRYPFVVKGYTIKKVGRASGSKLLIFLKERRNSDWTAAPSISYSRTRQDPVRGTNRVQSSTQTFKRTLSLEKVTGTYLLTLHALGDGTISSADGQTVCTGRCAIPYLPDTLVGFVAEPGEGSDFAGWSGACADSGVGLACSVVMDATKSAEGNFVAAEDTTEPAPKPLPLP